MTQPAAATSTPAIGKHPAKPLLLLGALGVVFGDIGTSPIYAFRESLKAAGGTAVAEAQFSEFCRSCSGPSCWLSH